MNKMRQILSICAIALSATVYGQDLSLYNLRTLPQNLQANPAHFSASNYYVAGGMLPLPSPIGAFPLNISVSNGFAFKDIIQGGTTTRLNPSDYISTMPETSQLNISKQMDLLNFGFKVKEKHFFWLNYQTRADVNALYSQNLFQFAWNGNGGADLLGDTTTISGFGVDAKMYSAIKFGWSTKLTDQLTFGFVPTLYIGHGMLSTRNTALQLYTSEALDQLTITPILEMEAAGLPAGDILNGEEVGMNPEDFIASGMGFGFDFGFNYQISDQFSAGLSVIDFGFINWTGSILKNNATPVVFEGLDASSLFSSAEGTNGGEDTSSTSFVDSLLGDVTNNLTVTDSAAVFNANAPTRIYMSGTYKINEKVNTGLLLRHTIKNGKYSLAASFNANVDVSNKISAVLAYNMRNRSYNNIGIGAAVNLGPIQFYMMMDDIIGLTQIDYAKNIDIRFGFNIRPSHNRKGSSKKVEKSEGEKK